LSVSDEPLNKIKSSKCGTKWWKLIWKQCGHNVDEAGR